jgi:hypothetical protein
MREDDPMMAATPENLTNRFRSVYRKLGVSSQAELIEKLKGSARPVLVRRELV